MAKRRANHEGTIYKRSNGAWRAQVSIQGRRLSYTGKAQQDCKQWLKETIRKLDSGYTYRSAQTTLGEFLENWLVSIQPSRAPGTVSMYRSTVRKEIDPALGGIKLKDLTPDKIQRLYDRRLAEGASPYTIKRIHKVLRCALNQGVKLGLLVRNPASATVPPKIPTKEMLFFNEGEAQQFLEKARELQPAYYPLFYLAIHTGMRKSELLALQWEDLDWTRRVLHVQRQLIWVEGKHFAFNLPKTQSSIRSIALGETAMQVLLDHRKGQERRDLDLIFATDEGLPLKNHVIYKSFKTIIREAGLPDIRFHDMRHTAASLMLNYGIPVIIVSRRLGHAKPSITMDVYGHIIPSRQEEAASLMDRLMTV